MNTTFARLLMAASLPLISGLLANPASPQGLRGNPSLDLKVKSFLATRSGQWHEMNVPAADGQLLHDLILKNGYKSALEIGTSTGHSGIWIAWALSKTGGKLITIEIDPSRHREALANFKEAGVADYIDARLADAHKLVTELPGPFDFVFSDADKEWNRNYFTAISPKLKVGGCFTTHNVESRRYSFGRRGGGSQDYLQFLESQSNFETTVNSAGGGVAICYKKSG